jgi:hypothetical protein
VSGYLRYYSNDLPVPQITVHVTSPTIVTSASSDSSGHYVLTDVPTENILVYPDSVGGTGAAISALDAAYVLQLVAGLRTFSAAQSLACDVTGNGSVSALDATLLLQYTTGLISRFPVATACNSDWAFVPIAAGAPNQTLIQPQPGPDDCTMGGIAYQTLTASLDEQNFSALAFGDCTGNWQPRVAGNAASAALAIGSAVQAGGLRSLPGGRLALSISGREIRAGVRDRRAVWPMTRRRCGPSAHGWWEAHATRHWRSTPARRASYGSRSPAARRSRVTADRSSSYCSRRRTVAACPHHPCRFDSMTTDRMSDRPARRNH